MISGKNTNIRFWMLCWTAVSFWKSPIIPSGISARRAGGGFRQFRFGKPMANHPDWYENQQVHIEIPEVRELLTNV